jgi:hypothetical protein
MTAGGWEPSGREFEYVFPEPDPGLVIDLPHNLDSVAPEIERHRVVVVDRLERGFARVLFPVVDRESAAWKAS